MPTPVPSQLEAIELPLEIGLFTWLGIAGVCLAHFIYLHVIDKLHCTKHAKLCRSSKTVSALRLFAAIAVLCVYVSGGNHQGFVCHENELPPLPGDSCAQGGGSWVFVHRFFGYAAALAATSYSLGLLIWTDSNSRFWMALFGAATWMISGVFGTYTGYENHHWWWFYIGFFALGTWLVVTFLTRRRRGLNITILLDAFVLLHVAALVIWILSPAGYRDAVLGIEVTHWFYLAFDILAYAVIPLCITLHHVPRRFAVALYGEPEDAYKHSRKPRHVRKLQAEHARCYRSVDYTNKLFEKDDGHVEYADQW